MLLVEDNIYFGNAVIITRVYSCINDIENVTNSKLILILFRTGIM